MKIILLLRDLFRKFPILLIANTALLLVVNLVGAATLFTIAPVIDYFLNSGPGNTSALTRKLTQLFTHYGLPVSLWSFLAVFLAFEFLKNAFYLFSRWAALKTWNIVSRDYYVGTFEKFFASRWLFFSMNKQGVLFNTLSREIQMIGEAFRSMVLLFSSLLQLIIYLVVPFCLSWQVTSISIGVGLIFAAPIFLAGRMTYNLGRQGTRTANELTHVTQEHMSHAKLIMGFGNQGKSVQEIDRAFSVHRRIVLWAQTIKEGIPLVYEPLGMIVVVIGLLVARNLSMPLSNMIIIFWSLKYVIPSLSNILTHHNALVNFYPSYEQLMSLRSQAEEMRQTSGKRVFSGFQSEIRIDHLSFAYPGHEPSLIDVVARIPKGKMVAFVGESGSGKSTLIDMIMAFNEPMRGSLTIDGVPVKEFDVNSYRSRIGYVPQDSILFNATIRNNLLWACPSATDGQIKRACALANADAFIRAFPHGYDALVGDRGVRLSGGERQRIAIARAILRRPEILILDEATSSLDTNSERLIQEAVENIAKETTVIAIAHRLSTIVNADYIYVLKKGRVVEEGSYSQLVNMNGDFHQMVKQQMLGIEG